MKTSNYTRPAVSLKKETFGRTLLATPIHRDLHAWLCHFDGDSDDTTMSLFRFDDLYFGPPDVYKKVFGDSYFS